MKLIELLEIIPDLEIEKDAEFNTLGMATTVFEEKEEVMTFLSEKKYLKDILKNKNIKVIVTTKEFSKIIPNNFGIILSDNPKLIFYKIHNFLSGSNFYWKNFENEIDRTAYISEDSIIEKKGIIIGKNTIIEPGVVVHSGTIIGDNVIIRSGSKIGTNGFQFFNLDNKVYSVKTGGRLVIKDNVEIQHNCCVDRGIFGGDTILSEYVKIDNFVHIAHDNIIGDRTLIAAGAKLAGRVTIGKDCWIGVNSTISNGIKIGNNCRVSLGSVVVRNVEDNNVVTGNFAIEHKKFIKNSFNLMRLNDKKNK